MFLILFFLKLKPKLIKKLVKKSFLLNQLKIFFGIFATGWLHCILISFSFVFILPAKVAGSARFFHYHMGLFLFIFVYYFFMLSCPVNEVLVDKEHKTNGMYDTHFTM